MKEYMLLIRNGIDSKTQFTEAMHTQFVTSCKVYIEQLTRDGKLISAQPLVREGTMVSGSTGNFNETRFDETHEIMVGYYHILANDMADAIAIAKGNPEFEYTTTARVEVRPIKMKEESIDFVYPKTA